jgi:hypothetical protein
VAGASVDASWAKAAVLNAAATIAMALSVLIVIGFFQLLNVG